MFDGFYRNRRVLVTGHTGFKGSWLSLWLKHLGATVHGFSLSVPSSPNWHELARGREVDGEIFGDVRDLSQVDSMIGQVRPEIVFHLAAQPLVRASYSDPLGTLAVNAMGTANVLEAVRRRRIPCTVIVATTDKCYENRGWEWAYRENDALGGHDVYSASKAAAELVVGAWRRSFFGPDAELGHVATVRAGNVIGGGDYAEDRIVPDVVRAQLANQPVALRNPRATRPWQHVLDCLSGYLWLGVCLAKSPKNAPLADSMNFGPGPDANRSVGELVDRFFEHWPGHLESMPDSGSPHEASRLNLAIDRAQAVLKWSPTWDFDRAVGATAEWYRERHQAMRSDMYEFSGRQLREYCEVARSRKAVWSGDLRK